MCAFSDEVQSAENEEEMGYKRRGRGESRDFLWKRRIKALEGTN